MPTKQQIRNTVDNIADLYRERPVEMLLATGALLGGLAKIAGSITDAQNANSWKREVRRRESMIKH